MSTAIKTMTAEELLAMPGDDFRYELIDGELKQMSPAGRRHGKYAARAARLLGNHVEENDLGDVYAAETGFLLKRNPDLVRAPDVAFVSKKRVEEIGDADGFFPGAPDLAIEVVSPGDTADEVEEKVALWFKHGARAVWVMYPKARAIVVHRPSGHGVRLTESDVLDGEDVVPGFRLSVADLFAS